MKVTEPVTIEQKRATPCTFSARSLGYACLILIGLASRDAFAQRVVVEFPPGVFEQTATMVRGGPTIVDVYKTGKICGWPSEAHLKSSISQVSLNDLSNRLLQFEALGTATGQAIANAMSVILVKTDLTFSVQTDLLLWSRSVAASPTELNFMPGSRCVDIEDARLGIFQIRRIIRAYLGMPPPTN